MNESVEEKKHKDILIDLQYLPSLEYFACLLQSENVCIEENEHFVKQTYRNRCHILGANKVEVLSVPVIKGNRKILVKDIKIDYNQKWLGNHWRAIVSAYGKAPFFEYYVSYFYDVFYKKGKFLFDFNYELLTLCLKLLQVDKKMFFSERYEHNPGEGVLDVRSVIHPKRDHAKNSFYVPYSYNQIFGKNFVENMSIIDLLFCEGPNASSVLKNSLSTDLNKSI